jgi:hypothetical protein
MNERAWNLDIFEMRVLVACEFSGIVRDAFTDDEVYTLSCDYLDTEVSGNHYVGDVMDIIDDGWDLMIAHPPCTHLAVSGARWFPEKIEAQKKALGFVVKLMNAPIQFIAIENPVSIISTKIRKPDQIVQPWQFGHGETKSICLWLHNLPKLIPTNIVSGRENRIHRMSPGKDRWKNRSRFYKGIAEAMAMQWTPYIGTKI